MEAPIGRVLLVMRHAKSAWDTGHTDHDRPLNTRGERDAARVGRALQARGWLPDLVVCSDAARTRETLAWIEQTTGCDLPSQVTPTLYLAGLGELIGIVRDTPDDVHTVMLLGHNPGCEELVSHFGGADVRMTTANVARLEAPELPWATLSTRPGIFKVAEVLRPGDLDG